MKPGLRKCVGLLRPRAALGRAPLRRSPGPKVHWTFGWSRLALSESPEQNGYKRAMAAAIRILGLDPGLAHMGWGVIALEGTRLSHIEHGVIATKPSAGLGMRLMQLHQELSAVIARLAPTAIAVEQAFVAKDPSAALKLGHARAVALLAAAQAGLEIAEYAPNHIKKSVVGAGHAGKDQVQFMVKRLLPTCGVTQADAADALACAIAHAHLAGTRARIIISQTRAAS